MEKVKKVRDFLKGKKTFAIGVLMIALGLLTEENTMVLEGIGFITLRAAIK
jgi:hypothetical protein